MNISIMKIENICSEISNSIAHELNLDDDKRDIINYGIISFIQMMICIALVIIFGVIFNVVTEALMVAFAISILRKSSGGVHATSPRRCAIIGTIISIGMGLIAKYINITFGLTILLGSIGFIYSYYIVYKLAPVDSKAKPINNINKRIRLRKNSMMILNIYLFIATTESFYFYFTMNSIVLVYLVCLCMGMVWQVFSLTKYGHLVIRQLDKLF